MTEEQRLKRNAYMREWTRRNSEKCNARARVYRASLSPEEKARQYEVRRKWAENQSPERKAKDTERIREYARIRRSTPEGAQAFAEASRRYRENNPEISKERYRRHNQKRYAIPENRKKKNEADARYRAGWTLEKKTEDRIRHLEWRRANPDRHNANNQRRRAAKKGNGGSYTAEEWNDLKAMFGNRCLRCGESESRVQITVDHVIPVTKGGSNAIENLQPLCYSCNASKQDRIIDYRPDFEEAA